MGQAQVREGQKNRVGQGWRVEEWKMENGRERQRRRRRVRDGANGEPEERATAAFQVLVLILGTLVTTLVMV